jgi:photosystem II stability/assembly factor-like uncharacterized protein
MKTKYYFTLLFLIFNIHYASAQWSQIGYMVTSENDTANGCHFIKAFGNNLYCGTVRGLFKSTNNGDDWSSITYTQPLVQGQDIFSIVEASNGNIFMGSNKRMFKSTDNGESWTWINSLPDSAIYYDIIEIGNNILVSWAKGVQNGVSYSNDFGNTWTAAGGIFSGVRYFTLDGNDLFLGGTTAGVYRSQNFGTSFNTIGLGLPNNPGIWSVKRVGNTLFANSVNGNGLWKSLDNAENWTDAAPGTFSGFCQVFSLVESNGILLASMDGSGCNVNQANSIKVSYDTGATWNTFLNGVTPPNYLPILGKNILGTSFFTKRGSGKEVFRTNEITSVSKNAGLETQLTIIPNPVLTTALLNLSEHDSYTIKITDAYGKLVSAYTKTGNQISIDKGNLPRGIYCLQVINSRSFSKTAKFIIE